MKIDFNGSFSQISRVLNQPRSATEKAHGSNQFEREIGDLRPRENSLDSANYIEKTAQIKGLSQGTGEGQSAKLVSAEPKLKAPDVERSGSAPESVEIVSDTVKTPTLLGHRRTRSSLRTAIPQQSGEYQNIKRMVDDAGTKHGIDPSLSLAVISAESSFNSRAVSVDGHYSKGLFQLLDSTGRDQLDKSGTNERYNPFDPNQNIDLGVRYLRYLHDLFSHDGELSNRLKTSAAANSSSLEKLAVAAFNAGEGRVASAQMRAERSGKDPRDYTDIEAYLPESTQKYVARVFASRPEFEDDVLD